MLINSMCEGGVLEENRARSHSQGQGWGNFIPIGVHVAISRCVSSLLQDTRPSRNSDVWAQ